MLEVFKQIYFYSLIFAELSSEIIFFLNQVFPLINEEVILGALHSPNDGTADPSALCSGLTSGAIAMGAQVGLRNIYIVVKSWALFP